MSLNWIKGITVGEVEASAKQKKEWLENDVMGMVLSGGLFAECPEIEANYERYVGAYYGEMINEIDYVKGIRERNRIALGM